MGQIKRIASVVLVSVVLGACSFLQGDLLQSSFWASSPFQANDEAELGIANLAKGNYVAAEGNFQKALRRNAKDVHALLGAGILYQNTGQITKAREMYEAVLAIRPDESVQFVVWSNISTRPASQIASVNLALLDSGGVPGALSGIGEAPPAPMPRVSAAPTTSVMLGRPAQAATPRPRVPAPGAALPSVPSIGKFAGGDANVISRFATIRALRDQGLLTQQEFNVRRRANLGALLPLTSPPPSAGLDRPVPSTEQITGRLRAIGRALEMRAISVTQHAAERNMILDALMPSAPVVVANPLPMPRGLMEAADSVRRLEQLRDTGYIGSDEYAKERQAIELAMQPKQPKMVQAAPTPGAAPAKSMKMAAASGPAVHLASFRTRKSADRGWAQIKRAHAKLIGGMESKISKVNLGRKGTYYRLKVGPFATAAEAKAMCRKLKRRRQYCEATVM
jgi:tetratricopeptide (TPR) repeat protein